MCLVGEGVFVFIKDYIFLSQYIQLQVKTDRVYDLQIKWKEFLTPTPLYDLITYLSACLAFNMQTSTVVGSIQDNTKTFTTPSMSHFIDLAFFEEHGQALHVFSIVHLSIPLPKLGWSHIGGTYTFYSLRHLIWLSYLF